MEKDIQPITLVLSAGGSWGLAHLGVLEVLEKEKIPIGRIVGTSMGAFLGGLYASGMRSDELLEHVREIDWKKLFSWHDLSLTTKGIYKGQKVSEFLIEKLKEHKIEDFPIPLATVASDIVSGEAVIFDSGDAVEAIRASISVPGRFHPLEWQGKILVDGAFIDPLPVDVARGYDKTAPVVAVDVLTGQFQIIGKEDVEAVGNLINIMDRAIALVESQVGKERGKGADMVVLPKIPGRPQMDFSYDERVVDVGREAARECLPKIAKLVDNKVS